MELRGRRERTKERGERTREQKNERNDLKISETEYENDDDDEGFFHDCRETVSGM